jgi:hypothetical protein
MNRLPLHAKLEQWVSFHIIPFIALAITVLLHFWLLLVPDYHFLLYSIDDGFVKGCRMIQGFR